MRRISWSEEALFLWNIDLISGTRYLSFVKIIFNERFVLELDFFENRV